MRPSNKLRLQKRAARVSWGVLLATRSEIRRRSVEVAGRSDLPVKPILFMSQRAPSGLHSFVSAVHWLIACALRELRTMLGVFAEDFRLLHALLQRAFIDMF